MLKIDAAEAKARLSYYLKRVEGGETMVCRRNVPIAEICPVPKRLRERRPVGIDRGMGIPSSFFDPLPDDLLDGYEGAGVSE